MLDILFKRYKSNREQHSLFYEKELFEYRHKPINLLQVGASSLGKAQNGMKAIMNLAVKVGEARLPNLPLDDGMKSTIKTGVQNWCTNEGNAISAKICSEL